MPLPLEELQALFPRVNPSAVAFARSQALTDKSANQIVNDLRAAGLGFRTENVKAIIASVRKQPTARQARLTTPLDIPLNPATFPPAPFNTSKKYIHNVLVRSRDTGTGSTANVFVSVSTNEQLSQQQILDVASGMTTNQSCNAFDLVESVEIQESYRSSSTGV